MNRGRFQEVSWIEERLPTHGQKMSLACPQEGSLVDGRSLSRESKRSLTSRERLPSRAPKRVREPTDESPRVTPRVSRVPKVPRS